ncbi:MAG: sulfate ABC transporter ATP-binding protein [Rhodocyclaceae bacterium]|nr:MAG: sulfate ABC transporter ATP-binding protein [Rhodocyclaceae bacterium]
MSIQVNNINKRFGDFVALDNVSLDFPSGELTALLGPSGCGKTTLLRIIAGLEQADSGQVLLEGEDASDTHVRERQVGFVFQHYALFRHMTVFDNVAFGLRVKPRKQRPSETEIRKKVGALLELVQLSWLGDRFPSQLSGGQRQRIALARALAVEPRVLLLDEPFGALDAKVRKELRRWLRRLHDELHITSLFVTHDQEEALEVSDRVVLMNKGKVEQVGPPQEVYEHPASSFVFGFLGSANRFHADGQVGFVRPHELDIITDLNSTEGLEARIARILSFGASARVELYAGNGIDAPLQYEVELSRERAASLQLEPEKLVRLVPARLRVFDGSDLQGVGA